MKKIPVLLLLVLLRVAAIAQPIHTLGNNPAAPINNYAVLPDHGYSFNTICTDTTLPFIANESLRPGSGQLAINFHHTLPSQQVQNRRQKVLYIPDMTS